MQDRPLHEPEIYEAIGNQLCKEAPCPYDMVKNGECVCFNEKQDNQPSHPEYG